MDKTSPLQWTLVRSPAFNTQIEGTPRGSSVSEEDFHLSLHDSQDSDSDSLVHEMKYQSELQNWIAENNELVHHGDEQEDSKNEGLNVDERKKESKVTPYKEIKFAKGRVHEVQQKKSNGRRQRDVDQYADLRYDPNWKKKEDAQPEYEIVQDNIKEGSFRHHYGEGSNAILEEINNSLGSQKCRMFSVPGKDSGVNETREQALISPNILSQRKANIDSEVCDSVSSLNSKLFLNEQLNLASNGYFALHKKHTAVQESSINPECGHNSDKPISNGFFLQQFDQASDTISFESGDIHRKDDADGETQDTLRNNQNQFTHILPKKDFIEKNKVTLGMSMPKQDSYLQLLSKKKGDHKPEQITSIAKVSGDAPTWTVIEDQQPVDIDPEDVWQSRARKLKERKSKSLQSNRGKSNSVFQERASKSHNAQHSSKQTQLSSIKDKKLLGGHIIIDNKNPSITEELGCVVNDISTSYFSLNTDVLEKRIESSIINSSPANSYKAHVNIFPQTNSSETKTHKCVSMNLISAEHYPYRSSESHANDLTDVYEHFPGKPQYSYAGSRPADAYVPSHLSQNQNKDFSTYSSQKTTNELNGLPQNHKVGIWTKGSFYSTENLRQNTSSLNQFMDCIPANGFSQDVRRQPQLAHIQNAESLYPNPVLPPILPRVESDTVLNAEYGERHEATLNRSNSEGYLLQTVKQNQVQENNSKGFRLKGFTNQEVKLGGLGPDYQSMKEKAEQLKQQKEYAKKVKTQNSENFSKMSKVQTKPTVEQEIKPAISRHKAMEYAKKIPKPKPLASFKSPDQDPKDEGILAHLKGNMLPQMILLEELQLRHEQEKQAVAAFRTLHIL